MVGAGTKLMDTRTAHGVTSLVLIGLLMTGCTASGICSEYSTPQDALEASDGVYGAEVTSVNETSRAVTIDTLGQTLYKGDAVGFKTTISIPDCAGKVPSVGDIIIVFLARDGDSLQALPGTPGVIPSVAKGDLPTSWP